MEKKIRVLHIITTASTNNGILTYVLSSMEASGNALSFDVAVLNRPDEWIASRFEEIGSHIYVLNNRNRNPIGYINNLKSIIQKNQYDIVHAHGNSCTLYTEMYAAKKAGACIRIAHAHNTFCKMKVLHKILRKPFDRTYTHAVACGKAAGDFLFAGKPYVVLKNGIESNLFAYDEAVREQKRKELGVDNRKVILHVGNFNAAKNQKFLLEPFKNANKKDKSLVLAFAGKGAAMDEVQKLSLDLGMTENEVRFLGRRDDIREILNAADVFALPSQYEGFPISLIEAQASGLPCLVADTVTPDSAILDGVKFLPLDGEKWTNEMLSVTASINRKDASQKLAAQGYDRKNASKELLDFYASALEPVRLKKLFVVTRNMAGGGCERVISQIVNTLASQGVNCRIFTQYAHESFYRLDERVRLTALTEKETCSGKDIPKTFLKLRHIVKKEKPDIILAMPDMVNVWTGIFLRGTGVPIVVSERNDPQRFPESKWKRVLRNPAYRNVQGFVFQTEQQREYFSKKIQNRSIVLDNPLDCNGFPLREKSDKTVVSVGRLSSQKNHMLLLEAFEIFHSRYPDWSLIVYGEGTQRIQLEEYAKSRLPDSVSFPGLVHNVPDKIKNAGMFVLSSDYEGMPNALIEAMAIGIPCISTDCPIGGPRSLIQNGDNGILVPVNCEKSLAEAMEKIASDRKEADRIGRNAMRIRERMDVKNIVAVWSKYLEENISKKQ